MDIEISKIRSELLNYGLHLDDTACDRISAYTSLLIKWNSKISLTTITKPTEILRFHFGESTFVAPLLSIYNGRLADVGSGAGFPGIALKIVAPSLDITLIESNKKKSAFISEVIRKLGFTGISVFCGRMNELPYDCREFDFITARAVGGFPELLKWSVSRLGQKGQIVLWLGDQDAGSLASTQGWKWNSPIRIPNAERRVVLAGSPISI